MTTMAKYRLPIIECMECWQHVGPNAPHSEDCSRYGKWVDYDVTQDDLEWIRRRNTPNR